MKSSNCVRVCLRTAELGTKGFQCLIACVWYVCERVCSVYLGAMSVQNGRCYQKIMRSESVAWHHQNAIIVIYTKPRHMGGGVSVQMAEKVKYKYALLLPLLAISLRCYLWPNCCSSTNAIHTRHSPAHIWNVSYFSSTMDIKYYWLEPREMALFPICNCCCLF